MSIALLFPGQGSQSTQMGKDLYERSTVARSLFEQADDILGLQLSKVMFEGSLADLTQTAITQPAIFVHSVALAAELGAITKASMVAGHSLGEFSALVVAQVLSFEDGLQLVSARAHAMQKACDAVPSTMAAVVGLSDAEVEDICQQVQQAHGEVIVPANYNAPGQLVISGSIAGVEAALVLAKEKGAKLAKRLPVNGAFHSPFMLPAEQALSESIASLTFNSPVVPIYQNYSAQPEKNSEQIRKNLQLQLTAPVRFTQSIQTMAENGATEFIEIGPGKVLQGLVKRIDSQVKVSSVDTIPMESA
jgi:[acyl-carrier-protein] S-malonyltransferase